jgi:hypothetical protein
MSRYQLLNQMVDFHEIQQEGHAIKGDLDATFFNPVASIFQKWRTLELLR